MAWRNGLHDPPAQPPLFSSDPGPVPPLYNIDYPVLFPTDPMGTPVNPYLPAQLPVGTIKPPTPAQAYPSIFGSGAPGSTNWLVLGAIALGAVLLLKKK